MIQETRKKIRQKAKKKSIELDNAIANLIQIGLLTASYFSLRNARKDFEIEILRKENERLRNK